MFFDSHSILLRQATDDGSNTAALARSGKSKSTFNRSGPCHRRCIARAKAEANVCFPPIADIGGRSLRPYGGPMLVPYWIECADAPGVGITARSESDALRLFEAAFGGERRASRVAPVHDASELDQGHVVPNMGNWLKRGIWYPLGYENVAEF